MLNNRIEKRFTFSNNVNVPEYRATITQTGETTNRNIRGYGVVFNQKSKIITEYVPNKEEYRTFFEVISENAFDDILNNIENFDIVLNINHRYDEILARTFSKTLNIIKDSKGLIYDTNLPATERGNDVFEMVKRGDYYESSFQFIVAEGGDKWEYDRETGVWVRTIMKIENLIDMCIATYRGAYNNTSISVNNNERKEYSDDDIAVAKRKLNELLKTENRIENSNDDYLVELENDNDRIKLL